MFRFTLTKYYIANNILIYKYYFTFYLNNKTFFQLTISYFILLQDASVS